MGQGTYLVRLQVDGARSPLHLNSDLDVKQNVELRIGELVLHGFPPSDRQRIGGAMERELARLFAEKGIPPSLGQGGEASRLDGGAFEVKPSFGAEAIGVRVAQAVYQGLSG